MAKINIQNGIISSSADYSLYHGTTKVADIEQNAIRIEGDLIAENYIVSSSVTYMTQSFSTGNTIFGDDSADTHQFTGSLSVTGSVLSIQASTDPLLVLNKTGGANAAIHFQHAGTAKAFIYVNADQTINLGTATTNPALSIAENGNVGINKTSLSKTLHVDSNIGSAGTPNGIMMTNTIDGSNSKIYMYANNDSSATKNSGITLDPDAETMAIDYNGNAITVDSSGNLGIGTSSPSSFLHISNSSVSTYALKAINTSTQSWGAYIKGGGDSGDPSLNVVDKNDNPLLYVRGDGNVGIGTSSPDTLLHTYQTSHNILNIENDGSGDIAFRGQESGTAQFALFSDHSDSKLRLVNYRAEPIEFSTDRGGTENVAMTILDSGNVGIADTSPAAKLVVVGDSSIGSTTNGLYFGNASGVGYIQGTDTEGSAYNALGFKTSANYALYIDTSGKVGIGTSSPGSTLTIKDTGDISTDTFISGITGDGFRITDGGSDGVSMEIDNIMVRNTLRTHIFQKDVVKATNGILIVSDSGVISGSTGTTSSGTVTFDNTKSATFSDDDILLFKDAADDGTINGVRFQINGSKSTSGDFDTYNVDNVSGNLSNLNVGGTAARLNGGTVTIDASTTYSPFIDVNASSGSAVMRMGNLAGITSPRFDTLSGFGLWASGSAYLEGTINATTGNIGGWGIGATAISSSGGIVDIDAGTKRITIREDASTDRIHLGEIGSAYGLKIFDGDGTADANRLVELGSSENMIAGWDIIPGTIKSDNADGSVALSATSQSLQIFTGSVDFARPKVVVGKLPTSGDASTERYGFGVFTGTVDADIVTAAGAEDTYTVLITKDKAKLAGWDLVPGNIESDNTAGSVRLSSISQSLGIWTGSLNETQPKLVLGKLPIHDGTVVNPYGLAVFSGTGDVTSTVNADSASVLITANKARLAGWELVPGRLKSGTVADINGNQASIALGGGDGVKNALTADATPRDGLFFVSASTNPVFYVGSNFSYVNDVLTAGGWKIGNNIISSSVGPATAGITIQALSSHQAIVVHGAVDGEGHQTFGPSNIKNVRLAFGELTSNKYGIKGFDASANRLFELSETRNEIAGWNFVADKLYVGTNQDVAGYTAAGGDLIISSSGAIHAPKFYMDAAGNAAFSGDISSGTGTLSNALTVGSNFSVDASGNMNASNAKFSGSIKALGGHFAGNVTAGDVTIGTGGITGTGYTINSSGIQMSGNSTININSAFIATSAGQVTGSALQFKGGSIGGMTVAETQVSVGTDLVLKASGQLTASSAQITGTITAKSGRIGGASGWEIGTGYIRKENIIQIDNGQSSWYYDGDDGYAGIAFGVLPQSFDNSASTGSFWLQYQARTVFRVGNASNFVHHDTSTGLEISSSAFHLDTANNTMIISGSITATSGEIGGFSITNNAISSSATPKRGLILKPGDAIRGYGNAAHSTTCIAGKYSFGVAPVSPPAGGDGGWNSDFPPDGGGGGSTL